MVRLPGAGRRAGPLKPDSLQSFPSTPEDSPAVRVPSPYSLVCSYSPSLAVPLIAVCAFLRPGELQTKNVTSLLLVARNVCEELSEECPRGAPLIRAPNVSVL